jgi:hypothetical protein
MPGRNNTLGSLGGGERSAARQAMLRRLAERTRDGHGDVTSSDETGSSSHIIPDHRQARKPFSCQHAANQLQDCYVHSNSAYLSAGAAPSDWLDGNTASIIAIVRNFLLPDTVKEMCISAVGDVSIYQGSIAPSHS